MNPPIFTVDPTLRWLRTTLAANRKRSRGYQYDPLANPFHRIWIGDGMRLSPELCEAFKISHVINCAFEDACPVEMRDAFEDNYICLNAIDSIDTDIFEWYDQFKSTMDDYLRDPFCTGVYVHCQAGMNRSATLAAAYIIKVLGMPPLYCLRRMILHRPCIMTNPSFQLQLINFIKKQG
jgi:hypothetical protein